MEMGVAIETTMGTNSSINNEFQKLEGFNPLNLKMCMPYENHVSTFNFRKYHGI